MYHQFPHRCHLINETAWMYEDIFVNMNILTSNSFPESPQKRTNAFGWREQIQKQIIKYIVYIKPSRNSLPYTRCSVTHVLYKAPPTCSPPRGGKELLYNASPWKKFLKGALELLVFLNSLRWRTGSNSYLLYIKKPCLQGLGTCINTNVWNALYKLVNSIKWFHSLNL